MVNKPNAITSSGFILPSESLNTEGPGLNPLIESAASIRNTAAAFPGIPKDKTGIRMAPDTDEFAASVAAIPSGAPSPNGTSIADFFSLLALAVVYPNVAAKVDPTPGSAPITVPITAERAI